jgi:hypothetical protein
MFMFSYHRQADKGLGSNGFKRTSDTLPRLVFHHRTRLEAEIRLVEVASVRHDSLYLVGNAAYMHRQVAVSVWGSSSLITYHTSSGIGLKVLSEARWNFLLCI